MMDDKKETLLENEQQHESDEETASDTLDPPPKRTSLSWRFLCSAALNTFAAVGLVSEAFRHSSDCC